MNVMTSCSLRRRAAQEASDDLNAILRIAGDADDGFVDSRNLRVPPDKDAVAIVSLMDF